MSDTLFQELDKSRGPFAPKPRPKEKKVSKLDPLKGKQGIMDPNKLIRILTDALNARSLSAKDRKVMAGHRMRLGDASWRLDQLMGKVNTVIWQNMINAQLDGFLKFIHHRQPNGRWMLSQWDAEIRPDVDSIERLFLVCKFVDESNESDLQYRNGVPIHDTNVNVKVDQGPTVSPELLEAVKAGSASNDVMERMMKLMEAQTRIQAAQAQVNIDDLLGAEPVEEPPKKK